MVALIDGQPKLCNLKDLIEVFLQHRREVVTRRTVFELRKARDRGHVLEGPAVALANIDEFIRIIRESPTPPGCGAELMTRSWDSELVRQMLTRAQNRWQRGQAPTTTAPRGWSASSACRPTASIACPRRRRRRSCRCGCNA